MSNVIRIDYTLADGNVWTEDGDQYDSEASLDLLAQRIADALRAAYPLASVTVTRENASGAVRVLDVETDDEYGIVEDDQLEEISAVADAVWEAGDWYAKA
jgi:hypothetical protein